MILKKALLQLNGGHLWPVSLCILIRFSSQLPQVLLRWTELGISHVFHISLCALEELGGVLALPF